MRNSNRKALALAAASVALAEVSPEVSLTVSPEVTDLTVSDPAPEPEVTPDPAPETVTPAATTSAPVYWRDADRAFTPRRGFETVLYAALADQRTESELVAHLLSSGDYARVAPRAAELRPAKPTRFLLKTWTAAGILRKSVN